MISRLQWPDAWRNLTPNGLVGVVPVSLVRLKRVFDGQHVVDIQPRGVPGSQKQLSFAGRQFDVGMSPQYEWARSIVDDAMRIVFLRHFDKCQFGLPESLAW